MVWKKKTKKELMNKRLYTLAEFSTLIGKDSGNVSRLKVWMDKAKTYPLYAQIDGKYIEVRTVKMIDIETVEVSKKKVLKVSVK